MPRTILLIEDDTTVGKLFKERILEPIGWNVVLVKSASQAEQICVSEQPIALVFGVPLGAEEEAVRVMYRVRRLTDNHELPCVFYSAVRPERPVAAAERAGGTAWLPKPHKPSELVAALSELVKK
jgi:DNA-binding response OmpR family regulator